MTRFRKIPVEVEAVQWTGENRDELDAFAGRVIEESVPGYLRIGTLEGLMSFWTGWYVIKGVEGEFYACKPSIFEKTYTPVDDTPGVGDHADELHTGALKWDPRGVTVKTVHEAFARRLTEYNDAQVRMGLPVLALSDPRDIARHVLVLASHVAIVGPSMDGAEALGAQVTALALAIARAEDTRLELGDAA